MKPDECPSDGSSTLRINVQNTTLREFLSYLNIKFSSLYLAGKKQSAEVRTKVPETLHLSNINILKHI